MQDWLEFVVKGLVDQPGEVTVTRVERPGQVLYELRVHPDDVGKVIGRKGATINALRALADVGNRDRTCRVNVDVVDEPPPED